MDIKRILSAMLGLPVVVIVLAFGNKYFIDVVFAIVALITMYEYFNAIKEKTNPVKWIGYFSTILIAFIHVIPNFDISYMGILLPSIVALLFIQSLFSEMKYNLTDIAVTLFGICYITMFTMCIPLLSGNLTNKVYLWYIIIASWGTDVFAYMIGKVLGLGKHKFSKISPNKTIEGCIAGTVGAIFISLLYTLFCNNMFNMNIPYIDFAIITAVLSILSQIGDFAASSIKRYADIKDFSNLIPGHGGMLDRIDSVIFIAPFAYLLYMVIL